jgi:integrase
LGKSWEEIDGVVTFGHRDNLSPSRATQGAEMSKKFTKTKYPGVYFLESSTRRNGIKADRCFYIRHRVGGKVVDERVGWWSDGTTADLAAARLAELKRNAREGVGPETLEEQRQSNKAQREVEKKAQAEQEKASIPFSDIWGQYIEQCRADGKKSIDREESFFRHWISSVIGNKPLAEIAPIHLEKIKANMGKAGDSPRSAHYCLAVIRQVFNYAARHDLFRGDNPVSKVAKPTVDNRRMRFLTFDEADHLLEALKIRSLDCWRLSLISLHCGLRFSELAGLTWGDVDVERNAICIRNPKNGRTRFAPMTDHVRDILVEMEPGGRSALIFPDRNGGERAQMSDTFDRIVAALGFNDGVEDPRQRVCFHTCRHTYASWLVEGGTDLFVVKELLGHKSLAMTERYSHLRPETLQAAAKNLGARLTEKNREGNVLPFRSAEDSQ